MTEKTMQEMREKPTEKLPAKSDPAVMALIQDNPALAILDERVFEHMYRIGTGLARSQLIPQHFQGKPDDCFIAVQMAIALKCQPMQVLQNLFVVHGTPGFSAKFMIALANTRGPFLGGIKFRSNCKEGQDLAVTAYATRSDTKEVVEKTVSLAMAKAEKWDSNPKYKSIPEQMLSYRAATFLVRLYCPEVLFGMSTADEIEDMHAAGKPVIDGYSVDYEEPLTIEREPEQDAPAQTTLASQDTSSTVAEPSAEPEQEVPDKRRDDTENKESAAGPSFIDVATMIRNADFANNPDEEATIRDVIAGFDANNQKKLTGMLENAKGKPTTSME